MKKFQVSRRSFLRSAAASLPLLSTNLSSYGSDSVDSSDPHFFIFIPLFGGVDWSYLTDARPLEMTNAGLIQNYTFVEPTKWSDGIESTLVSQHFQNHLSKFKDQISIVNGIMMHPSLVGHEQNQHYVISGSPAPESAFLGHLNDGLSPQIMDYVQLDSVPSLLRTPNRGVSLNLDPKMLKNMVALAREHKSSRNPLVDQFIRQRLNQFSGSGTALERGAAALNNADQLSTYASQQIAAINPDNLPTNLFPRHIKIAQSLFRNNICKSVVMPIRKSFDSHSIGSKSRLPNLYESVSQNIATILYLLSNTEYSSDKSLLDVTTVYITSEFGRSMRKLNRPFETTGTDHNVFNNSAIFAGKGIRGGQIIGQTDFRSSTETLSGSHQEKDRRKVRIMGRPFDANLCRSSPDLPAKFDAKDYLSSHSVVNSISELFRVDTSLYRRLDRRSAPSPILKRLLV